MLLTYAMKEAILTWCFFHIKCLLTSTSNCAELKSLLISINKLIKLWEDNNKYSEELLMYEQVGYWEHMLRRFEDAIIWFKKQLELAWFEKDRNSEKSAYFNLARENFYLGDLDKANFYHDRMTRGKVENDKSSLKTMSYHVIKSKRDAKLEK